MNFYWSHYAYPVVLNGEHQLAKEIKRGCTRMNTDKRGCLIIFELRGYTSFSLANGSLTKNQRQL